MSERNRTTPLKAVKWRRFRRTAVVVILLLITCVVTRKAPRWARNHELAVIERRGDRAFQEANNATSESCWRLVLEERPDSTSARNKLAILCMKENRFAEARKLLREGIRRAPKTVSFRFNLGQLHYMTGDFRGALSSLGEVEQLNPGHGNVHFLKGVIYERLGEEELARKEFVKELNNDPATLAAWARLAESTLASGAISAGRVSVKTP